MRRFRAYTQRQLLLAAALAGCVQLALGDQCVHYNSKNDFKMTMQCNGEKPRCCSGGTASAYCCTATYVFRLAGSLLLCPCIGW